MAAHHADWFAVKFSEEISNVRTEYITLKCEIETFAIQGHILKAANHVVNDLAVGNGGATDDNWCLHSDNWIGLSDTN
ncbi:hypothetical protein D3C86_2062320 [compost metagenome]